MIAALGCICLCAASNGARADGEDGGFLGRVLQGIANAAVQTAWAGIEPEVQDCLNQHFQINPQDMASQNIPPGDPRVAPDIDTCRQAIANGEYPPQQQPQQADAPDPAAREKELTARYGAKAAKKIAAGNIDIGMNGDEVKAAWGEPDARAQAAHGREKWSYGKDTVTFAHGKVIAVGH